MSDQSADMLPLEQFRLELEERIPELNQALLSLENAADAAALDAAALDLLMRSLHSIKGAAAILGLIDLVTLTHALEDRYAAVKAATAPPQAELIELGFAGIDLYQEISRLPADAIEPWLLNQRPRLEALRQALQALHPDGSPDGSPAGQPLTPAAAPGSERVVKVEADNLNRIMGLSGELLVEARWLQPFADSLSLLRQRHKDLQTTIEALRLEISASDSNAAHKLVDQVHQRERECRELLSERLAALELYALRTTNLSDRLYREVIGSNMRPFADALVALPRLVRDLAASLGKQVQLEMVGRTTLVDRDILRRLEAPLIHLLRNAVDHGIEPPAQREACGKPARGTVRIEAVHRGGMLSITVSDDGGGVALEAVRARLVDSGRCSPAQAEHLSADELQAALEQPGFSTATAVTEVSGRGVGLDVVRAMVSDVGGMVRLSSQPGHGTTIHFQLPLTLSVVRTLLVEIGAEPYALPLARLDQIVAIEASQLQRIEGREAFSLDGVAIGLISARQVLGCAEPSFARDPLPVVVISDHERVYGVVVDRVLGEQDLVVRPLDPRLGKVTNISAAALMGDGQPILVVDTAELVRSIDRLLQRGQPLNLISGRRALPVKRVLIADDSRIVLDLQARLLRSHGYQVERASDGAEALRAIRANPCDLLVTDLEMPVLDGIELIRSLRREPQYARLPIVISSSRDREEDRLLGLEAGADYYLVKSDFQNETLLEAVHQLIGPPSPAGEDGAGVAEA